MICRAKEHSRKDLAAVEAPCEPMTIRQPLAHLLGRSVVAAFSARTIILHGGERGEADRRKADVVGANVRPLCKGRKYDSSMSTGERQRETVAAVVKPLPASSLACINLEYLKSEQGWNQGENECIS